jgi:predicted DNA binding CopG/RHH family protein
MKKNILKQIPKFKNEKAEAEFWSSHDSAEYIDYAHSKRAAFPNLKPTTRTISIRLPESLIEHIKQLANKRDVPYQSLIKIFLAEKVVEKR